MGRGDLQHLHELVVGQVPDIQLLGHRGSPKHGTPASSKLETHAGHDPFDADGSFRAELKEKKSWHLARVAPVRDRDGAVVGWAGTAVDVDERAARDLAASWGRPLLDHPMDHGVTVPVLLGPLEGPVVGVALAEGSDPTADATALADAANARMNGV